MDWRGVGVGDYVNLCALCVCVLVGWYAPVCTVRAAFWKRGTAPLALWDVSQPAYQPANTYGGPTNQPKLSTNQPN